MTTITVLSVSWRSTALLTGLIDNLRELAAAPGALRFVIADNTAGNDPDISQLEQAGCTVVPVDVADTTMSVAHAAGLNALMSGLETPYTLIIDPDVALFLRGWDEILLNRMQTEDLAAIGAPYPPWKLGKYHDFPSPPFALWDTRSLVGLAPDWRPYGRSTGARLVDFALRQTFWLPRVIDRKLLRLPPRVYRTARWMERGVGVVSKDTGWEIAARARRQRLKACVFEMAPRQHATWQGVPPDLAAVYAALATQFELYTLDGAPILTHRNPTLTRLSFNLWTNNNVLLYQDTESKAEMTVLWQDLVARALAYMQDQ